MKFPLIVDEILRQKFSTLAERCCKTRVPGKIYIVCMIIFLCSLNVVLPSSVRVPVQLNIFTLPFLFANPPEKSHPQESKSFSFLTWEFWHIESNQTEIGSKMSWMNWIQITPILHRNMAPLYQELDFAKLSPSPSQPIPSWGLR